jgi:hypothetical protein
VPVEPPVEEECMNVAGIHMVKVEGMDMVEKRPSNHWSKDDGVDMEEERPSKKRPKVEGMNMMEDMTADVDMEVVEKEHGSVMLAKH